MVLSDDHSVPHLGCYGDEVIKTPHLDRFASEGLRFDRAYTSAPQCSPSRAAIFTGHSPQRVCMTRLATPLPPEHKIFPELLREAGYFTGVCRRWHHMDGRNSPKPWLAQTYQRHDMRTMSDRMDYVAESGDRSRMLPQINEFLDQRGSGQPFFLQVNFNDPHRRWDRNAIDEPHRPEDIPLSPLLPDLPEVREDVARYYDEVSRLDSDFGQIIELLDERGLSEDTIVIFMGDNGHALPRGKWTLYHQGVHVPMIVSWPGHTRPGSSTDELVSGVDWAATCLDVAGVAIPESLEGRTFRNVLENRGHRGRDYVFASQGWHQRLDMGRSVTSKTHLLIYNCLPERGYQPLGDFEKTEMWKAVERAHLDGRLEERLSKAYFSESRPVFELYDLRSDPHQFENLAGLPEHHDVEQQLKAALDDWMESTYDFLPPPFAISREWGSHPL